MPITVIVLQHVADDATNLTRDPRKPGLRKRDQVPIQRSLVPVPIRKRLDHLAMG